MKDNFDIDEILKQIIEENKSRDKEQTIERVTLLQYIDSDVKMRLFYTNNEDFIFNKLIPKLSPTGEQVFEVGLLALKMQNTSLKRFSKWKKNTIYLDDFTDEDKFNLELILAIGTEEIRQFLLMVYYTRNCLKKQVDGTMTFEELVRDITGQNYKIHNIRHTAVSMDEKSFVSSYDRMLKSIQKITVVDEKTGDSIPVFSRAYQESLEESINSNNLDKNQYSNVVIGKSAKEDLKFYLEKVSSNLAYKRLQSGKVNLIKEKDMNELREMLQIFFEKTKGYSKNQSRIIAENITSFSQVNKQEEYYDKVENICKDILNDLAVELAIIQMDLDDKSLEGLIKKEIDIIENYIIHKN